MTASITDEEIQRDLAFAIVAARNAGQRALSLREAERWEGKMLADIGDQAAPASSAWARATAAPSPRLLR